MNKFARAMGDQSEKETHAAWSLKSRYRVWVDWQVSTHQAPRFSICPIDLVFITKNQSKAN